MDRKEKLKMRQRLQKLQSKFVTGIVVLNDSQPSDKSVSSVADAIIRAVDPANRSIVEQARRDVLELSKETE
jgi:hypothetical protein